MFTTSRRRVAAGCLVLAAGALGALLPAGASAAADGSYTHVLCGDPSTGLGVGGSSPLPDGITTGGENTFTTTAGCAAGAQIRATDGLVVTSGRGYSTTKSMFRGWLRYTAPDGVEFGGAELYRAYQATVPWGMSVVSEASTSPTSSPAAAACWHNHGCTKLGSTATPFGSANRMTVPAWASRGFTATVHCHMNEGTLCTAQDAFLRIYGGRVTLRDTAPPEPGAVTGPLADDRPLAGLVDLGVTASDGGGGVYRVVVRVDGEDRAVYGAGSNAGRCADVNPGNDDPYEFAYRRPCATHTAGEHTFDTLSVADGEHRVVVQVEDAAGNRATALDRRVTIDNYAPPVSVSAPVILGSPRRGGSLAVTPASFDDHGLPGDPVVTRRWERCRADGSGCVAIPGASGITYTLGNGDVNRSLRVVETATNSEGSATATSVPTARVVREDGTLPPDNDDVDNDCDGEIDEPSEPATCPVPPGPTPVPGPTIVGSSQGARGLDGSDGRDGASVRSVVQSTAQANGEGASPRARLTATFTKGGTRSTVAYGRNAGVRGRLVDESGRPIRNAIVDVVETRALRGAKPVPGRPVVTDGDGAFTYRATSKPGTRTVSFTYRYQRAGAVVTQANLALTVRAAVRLSVKLRGIVARYSGRVVAGSMPRGGKLVIVQGRAKGGSWQTFASRRASKKNGTFKGRYRLKIRRPGKKLQFRVRVLGESGWNFASATSKTVTRQVR
jgi:hypothetical protein